MGTTIERKVYSSWAFTENEQEKSRINYEIYKKELEPKSKEFGSSSKPTTEELQKYTCYQCIKHGYGHNVYVILSNPHNFDDDQLALICDHGNLCFGYSKEGSNKIVIFTD